MFDAWKSKSLDLDHYFRDTDELVHAFDRACASSQRNGLPLVLHSLQESVRSLRVESSAQFKMQLADSASAFDTWRAFISQSRPSQDGLHISGWLAGFSFRFDEHLTLVGKGHESWDAHIKSVTISGKPRSELTATAPAQREATLVQEQEHVRSMVSARLATVVGALAFDNRNEAPALLAESLLRTVHFLSPLVQMYKVSLILGATDHFPGGIVSVWMNDDNTIVEASTGSKIILAPDAGSRRANYVPMLASTSVATDTWADDDAAESGRDTIKRTALEGVVSEVMTEQKASSSFEGYLIEGRMNIE
jgi:hypothetical protein